MPIWSSVRKSTMASPYGDHRKRPLESYAIAWKSSRLSTTSHTNKCSPMSREAAQVKVSRQHRDIWMMPFPIIEWRTFCRRASIECFGVVPRCPSSGHTCNNKTVRERWARRRWWSPTRQQCTPWTCPPSARSSRCWPPRCHPVSIGHWFVVAKSHCSLDYRPTGNHWSCRSLA